MPSTFFGIEIGQRGLAAAQIGQDVTGHNIANAGTTGYSVQRADQAASDPLALPSSSASVGGMLGTGVIAGTITRARDQFLDSQVHDATSNQNLQTAQQTVLQQVGDAFGEPSDTGLNAAIGKFFGSFNDLASNPEDAGVRSATVQSASSLAQVFQGVQARLSSTATQTSSKAGADMQTLNSYGSQIAALNVTIRQATAQGQAANDLMDRRDLLLDKLSGLANITTTNRPDGTVNVAVGNTDLVLGTDSSTLSLDGPNGLTARGDLKSGELAGLAQAATDVQGYQSDLDHLAQSVIGQVNAQQAQGRDLNNQPGGAFFVGTDARTINVSVALLADPSKVAAAATPVPPATFGPGDGSNALVLAALKDQTITTSGDPLQNKTLQGFYQNRVSDAAGKAATAKTAGDSATASATQLGRQRDSVTGVSSDTEMVNMLQYQRSYQASARVVKTMDEMVGTLINDLFAGR
ncbi:MAG: flagellar hook-associated protein FlgK [Armatimonadota bacterium]|nr:flagellar hook-associated protein FlgK [Armatimonadota bacterium]